MTICPIALAVGCEKCPAFNFCPLTTVLGDQEKEEPVSKVWEESFPPEKNKDNDDQESRVLVNIRSNKKNYSHSRAGSLSPLLNDGWLIIRSKAFLLACLNKENDYR